MKVCIIQPPYSTDYSKIDEYFNWQLDALAKCDKSMDIIVLPESCDVPCLAKKQEDFFHCFSTTCTNLSGTFYASVTSSGSCTVPGTTVTEAIFCSCTGRS